MAEAVVAVEADEQMAKEAQETLINADIDNVIVHTGALSDGAQQHGPYDVMIVQGGVAEVPEALLAQLKNGGRIACLFMEGPLGEVRLGYKSDHGISWRKSFNAAAPLLNGFTRAKEFQL